jgi:hypothetical protein
MKEGRVFSGYNDILYVLIFLHSIATAFAFGDHVVIHVAWDISVRAPHWVCTQFLALAEKRAR